jgi:tetratricopeptide (TPR) repeat protein
LSYAVRERNSPELRYLLILLLFSGSFATAGDLELEKAIRAHQSGDLTQAEAGYRDFLRRHPKVFEIRSNLGAVLAQQGRYVEATAEYKTALELAPGNPGILLNLALAEYKAGQVPSAAERLEKLQQIAPEHLQGRLLLADCLLQMNQNGRVIGLLEPLAAQRPDDLAVTYMLGTALVRENRIAEGQKLLDRILRAGDSAAAKLLLGTAKFGMGEFAEALVDFQKAVELNPKLPAANGYLGRALLATGDMSGAAVALKNELQQNPNDFEANLHLAVILKQDQEYPAAKQHLERALLVRPGDVRVRYQQGTIALAEGEAEKARKILEAVVKESPQFVEAHVTLATVYYRLKRKADGDRERAIVERLNQELQDRQPKGEAIRGGEANP